MQQCPGGPSPARGACDSATDAAAALCTGDSVGSSLPAAVLFSLLCVVSPATVLKRKRCVPVRSRSHSRAVSSLYPQRSSIKGASC